MLINLFVFILNYLVFFLKLLVLLHELNPTESEAAPKSGWALKIIKKKPEWANAAFEDGGVETYFLFPKQVAYHI